jgi:hypothetical protein
LRPTFSTASTCKRVGHQRPHNVVWHLRETAKLFHISSTGLLNAFLKRKDYLNHMTKTAERIIGATKKIALFATFCDGSFRQTIHPNTTGDNIGRTNRINNPHKDGSPHMPNKDSLLCIGRMNAASIIIACSKRYLNWILQ